MGHPTCIIEGLACWLTLCILEKIICNSTNSVQISFIETLKLIVFSWTIWWCYWQNVLMINEKNNFLTVSWLSGLLSAEIFISTGEWGVQMPPLTSENSYFLRSGPQGATLVMTVFDDKSTMVQVMAWCHQACCHMLPYGITRPQWVTMAYIGLTSFNLNCTVMPHWFNILPFKHKHHYVEINTGFCGLCPERRIAAD